MKNKKAFTVLLIILCVPSVGFSEVRTNYYENGNLKSEFSYKNDKLEGVGKRYSESGELISEANFKNGKKEGPFKVYIKKEEQES